MEKYTFDKETIVKILKGSLIAGGGALVIYFLQGVSQLDFGAFTPAVVAIASIAINAVKEWMSGE